MIEHVASTLLCILGWRGARRPVPAGFVMAVLPALLSLSSLSPYCYAQAPEPVPPSQHTASGAPVWSSPTAPPSYTHLGPVEVLDNGVVTLGVALRVGRIVSYQRKARGEENWLGVTDQPSIPSWHWHPWGGDRVWPTVQALNPQIYRNTGFDPVIDGKPWEVIKRTASSMEIRSGTSTQLGIRITRRIELLPGSAEVVHTFVVEKLTPSIHPVHVWAVTGLRATPPPTQPEAGRYFLMDNTTAVPHMDFLSYKLWPDSKAAPSTRVPMKELQTLLIKWPDAKIKVGTYGTWIAFIWENSAFLQTISYDPKSLYLDHSSLQTYAAHDPQAYEIETLSPSWIMAPGETKTWHVRWNLLDFADTDTSVEARTRFLKAQAALLQAVGIAPAATDVVPTAGAGTAPDGKTPSAVEGGSGSTD